MPQIHIRPADGHWTARAGGAVIARSNNALELIEGSYPPVIYFPQSDVSSALLEPSVIGSTCPHKGAADHFDIITPATRIDNAVWSYAAPRQTVGAIAGHFAFYTDKVSLSRD